MDCKINSAKSLAEKDYCFIPKNQIQLSDSERNSFFKFQKSWNNLGPDFNIAEDSDYRRGRYSLFEWDLKLGELNFLSNKRYLMYGNDGDHISREMFPVSYLLTQEMFFYSILEFLLKLGISSGIMDPKRMKWHVDFAQYRVEAEFGIKRGDPTPDGPHQDKVEFMVVVLINRYNITPEQGLLHNLDLEEIFQTTYDSPLDMLIVNDRRLNHHVTSFGVSQPWIDLTGFRDTLVVGFSNPGFNPNFEGSPYIEKQAVKAHWPGISLD